MVGRGKETGVVWGSIRDRRRVEAVFWIGKG